MNEEKKERTVAKGDVTKRPVRPKHDCQKCLLKLTINLFGKERFDRDRNVIIEAIDQGRTPEEVSTKIVLTMLRQMDFHYREAALHLLRKAGLKTHEELNIKSFSEEIPAVEKLVRRLEMERTTEETIGLLKDWMAKNGSTENLEKLVYRLEHEGIVQADLVPEGIFHDLCGGIVSTLLDSEIGTSTEAEVSES